MPGGFTELAAQGAQGCRNPMAVLLIHAVRVFTVVSILPMLIPFLFPSLKGAPAAQSAMHIELWDVACFLLTIAAGFALSRVIPIVAGQMMIPLAISGALHMTGFAAFHVAPNVLSAAQIFIGLSLVTRMLGGVYEQLLANVFYAQIVTAIHLCVAIAGALVVSWILGQPPERFFLAFSPGGIAEMSLVALSVGVEAAFVSAHHLFRILLVVVPAPWLAQRFARP